jgi:hypothetical protein
VLGGHSFLKFGKTKRSYKIPRAHQGQKHYLATSRLALVSSQELQAFEQQVVAMAVGDADMNAAAAAEAPAGSSSSATVPQQSPGSAKWRLADSESVAGPSLGDILNAINAQSHKTDSKFEQMHRDIVSVSTSLEASRRESEQRFQTLENRMSLLERKGPSTAVSSATASSAAASRSSSVSAGASAAGSGLVPPRAQPLAPPAGLSACGSAGLGAAPLPPDPLQLADPWKQYVPHHLPGQQASHNQQHQHHVQGHAHMHSNRQQHLLGHHAQAHQQHLQGHHAQAQQSLFEDIRGAGRSHSRGIAQQQQHGAAQEEFVPTRLFLRGWSPYHRDPDRRVSIDEASAKELMAEIYGHLDSNMQNLVRVHLQPCYRNFQLTWILQDNIDRQSAFRLRDRVKAICTQHSIMRHNKEVYCALEEEVWKNLKKRGLSQAFEAAQGLAPHHAPFLHRDWVAGALFLKSHPQGLQHDVRIGFWHVKNEMWIWTESGLAALGVSEQQAAAALSSVQS